MSTRLKLRDYQEECLSRVAAAWEQEIQRPAVVLPTGSGKTVIFAHLSRSFTETYRQRVLVLVHRDELADQAISKIRSIAPGLEVGKIKAQADDTFADVMVASVQTLSRPDRLNRLLTDQKIAGKIGLVIVDECHHAVARSYETILYALGCYTPQSGTKAVGFTATLARGDSIGLGDVWQDVVFNKSVLWMISRGYLVDIRGRDVDMKLDLSGVKKSGGDYQASSLGSALLAAKGPEAIARAMLEHAGDRRSIVFTPDVKSAYATAGELDRAGIACGVVEGGTAREERQLIYKRFASGELRALVNCMVLTEGFDAPWADCAVIARPTQSAPLYVQMVGRVTRPWPQKNDALVLNVSGSGGRISTLIDLAPGEVPDIGEGETLGDAAVREEERQNSTVQAGSVAFALKHRDIDLFTASAHAWLRTRDGVMFIPVGDEDVFLWPDEDAGLWSVCRAGKTGKWVRLHTGLGLGLAQAWAETEAEERMPFNGTKSASWRKGKPSEPQKGFARTLGIDAEGMRRGALSDAISVALASRKFDRYVRSTR